MSFKVAGTDTKLLKNLQYRRVSELLGEHIPDDEAKLLSNGRLTCLVCLHRPIFDTLPMLSIHRKGKKHLFELSKHLQHKREVELKKIKEIQSNSLRNGKPVKNITKLDDKDSISKLLSPRSLTKKFTGYNRKQVIESYTLAKQESQIINISLQKSETAQVRKYLKSLCRKRPLSKTINKLRDNTVPSSPSDKSTNNIVQDVKKADYSAQDISEAKYYIKMKESGWIQDTSGKWVKDPDVEFDSDEEEPAKCF